LTGEAAGVGCEMSRQMRTSRQTAVVPVKQLLHRT